MSKKQRKRRNHKPDLHLHLGPTAIKDRAAAEASCAIDAAADRKWFQQRPGVNERERLASPRELQAAGLPVCAMADRKSVV